MVSLYFYVVSLRGTDGIFELWELSAIYIYICYIYVFYVFIWLVIVFVTLCKDPRGSCPFIPCAIYAHDRFAYIVQ